MKANGKPFVTDEGHHILDCNFGKVADPPKLARALSDTPGVVEHGLFIALAKMAIVGKGNSVVEIRPKAKLPRTTRLKRAPRKPAVRKRRRS